MTITTRDTRDKCGNRQANLKTVFFKDFFSKTAYFCSMTHSSMCICPMRERKQRETETTMTYSNLTQEDRNILSLMKTIDYGRLEHLVIQDGHIAKTKDSRMVRSIRFDAKNTTRETDKNFLLSEKHMKFLDDVRKIGNAVINTIQIQAGLPVSMEIAKGF